MDTEFRQLINAALRSYELGKNTAFRRLNSSISRAMILEEKPKSMVVIGAGAIGIEFAHFYNSYGTDVTIIEELPADFKL